MKPTMKKWLTGLLSAALLAGNLPVYALNTAYAAEEDGFFTDETDSFEGGSQESEDTQSEDSFASVSEFTGFTSGEAEEDFSGEEDFEASDSQEGFEGETDPIIMPETDAQDEGGYLQNLTLYTSQSGASTVGLKRMSDLDAEFGGKVYVAEYGSNMDSASFWITADLAGNEAEENISFEIVPEKTILEKAAAPIQKILSGKTEKEQKNRQGEKENRYFAMLKWIVIGSIITILLIMTGVVLCRRKKDSAKEEQADEE